MEQWEKQQGVAFLRKIGVKLSQTVLDFGCRTGHYTIPAAKIVGRNGIVYAVDKDKQALDELKQKAAYLDLKNIRTIETSGQVHIDLENNSVDVVLFYDVLHYHEKREREKLNAEAYRVLKQNGLLSVYPKHTLGDDPVRELSNLSVSDVKLEIENSKFTFEHKFCGLISHDDSLNQGCVLNFRKEKKENDNHI